MDKQMILPRSISGIAFIKTTRSIVHDVVSAVFLLSIEKRTLEGKCLLDSVMVSQCGKHGEMRGRICEVHVPASRFMYFTPPYSHLRRSTGILPCGAIGCRRSRGTP